jgi:outer membrane protein OmpA-like peptidoglycan-associated protein
MSYSYVDKGASSAADTGLQSSAAWLLAKQASTGEVARGDYSDSPPIVQGSIVTTANAAFAFAQAFAASHDPRFQSATDKAVAFIAAAPVQTTQDKVFKILALAHLGGETQRPVIAQLVAQLQSEQDASGGWKEAAEVDGPNAFATGQVLYAFKQAGVSLDSSSFSHGVDYLLRTQKSTGAWESGATQSPSHTEFAPTMWAIIGLAGSFSAKRSDGEPPPTLERRFKTAVDSTGKLVLHVNFDFDKATLRPDAAPILDQVAALMRDHADWRFEIDGYTDNVGTDPHNQTLSEARARSVMNALIDRRIDAQRMSSAGFGKGGPVATNDTEEGRYANRRVELVRQ